MQAGKLRERVEIHLPETASDLAGGQLPLPGGTGWRKAGEVWAAVVPLSSSKFFADGRFALGITHEVRMRPPPLALPDDFSLLWRGKRLYPRPPVDVDARGRELTILCEEREAA